ncbi:hypothetical protein [Nocardia amamiensis]|uniref:hypothetical protein n=1 Tax=Nocardia TaxID=1817 RepID=UPI003402EA09
MTPVEAEGSVATATRQRIAPAGVVAPMDVTVAGMFSAHDGTVVGPKSDDRRR